MSESLAGSAGWQKPPHPCSSTLWPPVSIRGDLLDGMSRWDGTQHQVPQHGTLTGCQQQKRVRRRLSGVPCPGQPCPDCLVLIGTHLTALIFLLKAEERIVSTIIPQRYIFQLYLELDTAVTLPAIASTPAPAVMNLKSLAPRRQQESLRCYSRAPVPPVLLCGEPGTGQGHTSTSAALVASGSCPQALPRPHGISAPVLPITAPHPHSISA